MGKHHSRTEGRTRGGAGVFWRERPPKPPSPLRLGRAVEMGIIFAVLEETLEEWARAGSDRSVLIVTTHWCCTLELPDSVTDIVSGPPLLSRTRAL